MTTRADGISRPAARFSTHSRIPGVRLIKTFREAATLPLQR
jgi:hypothetical protein